MSTEKQLTRNLEQAKERLRIVKEQEKEFNREISNNDKQIKQIQIKNKKIAKKISSHMKYMALLEEEIESKTEEVKEQLPERIKVSGLVFDSAKEWFGNWDYKYTIATRLKIPEDKFPLIKQAIEKVLNDGWLSKWDYTEPPLIISQKEVDAIRKETWEAARSVHSTISHNEPNEESLKNFISHSIYKTFEDYLSSLNSNDTYTSEYPAAHNDARKEEEMSNKKIEIQSILNTFKNFDGTQTYEIKVTDLFPPNSGEKIKDAIESVINNAFVWTPELINEFMNEGEEHYYDWSKEIKQFEQSKQYTPVEEPLPTKQHKEWIIESFYYQTAKRNVAYKATNGYFFADGYAIGTEDEMLKSAWSIHSVRRLKDGAIFKIGEEVNYGVIERMIISWVGLEVQFTNGSGATLASIEKLPTTPSKPIEEDKPLHKNWGDVTDWFNKVEREWFNTDCDDAFDFLKQKLNSIN